MGDNMIDEKSIEVQGKEYVISKLPATVAREILFLYPSSNIPKIGDYATSERIMLLLMSYVGVRVGDSIIPLKTKELVNNHVPDAETLILIEKEMFKYNYSFFQNGNASTFLTILEKRATTKGIEILTTLLERLSQAGKQA